MNNCVIRFLELIQKIDNTTTVEFRGKAYNWMDENHNGMYTKARKEMEQAVDVLLPEGRNFDLLAEINRYEETVMNGLKMYAEETGIDLADVLVEAIKEQKNLKS